MTSGDLYESHRLRLRQFRLHLNLSQADFAIRLGATQQTVSAIEKGRQDVTLVMLYSLLSIDCNPSWLLFNQGPMLYSEASRRMEVAVRENEVMTEYVLRIPKKTDRP